MRLILHIGSSKTGTTSIQNFFWRYHQQLKDQGIFYPIHRCVSANHFLLQGGFVRLTPTNLPGQNYFFGNTRRFKRFFNAFLGSLLTEIDKSKPDTVVLSSESLFKDFSAVSHRSIAEFLSSIFDEIEVIAYVRSPLSDYLARFSQHVRSARLPPASALRPIKKVLEYYEEQFPGLVNVYPFERSQLVQGDIVNDFLAKLLPEALEIHRQANMRDYNISLPLALLVELFHYRAALQKASFKPSISTRALVNSVVDQYQQLNNPSAHYPMLELRQEVKQAIIENAGDYQWLKDNYAVEFSDLDYAKISGVTETLHYDDMDMLFELKPGEQPAKLEPSGLKFRRSFLAKYYLTLNYILQLQLQMIYKANISHTALAGLYRQLARR